MVYEEFDLTSNSPYLGNSTDRDSTMKGELKVVGAPSNGHNTSDYQ